MWSSWKRIWTIDDPQSVGARLVLKPAMEGLRLTGKQVFEFVLDRNDPLLGQHGRESLQDFVPDAILLANHPSSLLLRQMGIEKVSCPVLVWLFDDPLLMGNESFNNEEIVLITDPRFEEGARARNAKKIVFVPVAAPDRVHVNLREDYRVPINYVGSIHVNLQARAAIPSELRDYLNRVIRIKVVSPQRTFEDILTEHPLAPGKRVQLSGPLHYYLYSEANRLYRIGFLKALAPGGLRLYGNETWRTEIQGTPLENCFRGRLDPFKDYPNLIHSALITVNLRSLQGFCAPTHRDFLVPRLGGFMLSSVIYPDGYPWNTIDPENVYHLQDFPWSFSYATPQEMGEAAAWWIERETQRLEWTQEAAKTIEIHHIYSQRMEQCGKLIDAILAESGNDG